MSDDSRVFVVTGIMRSGTSFLSRNLNELGIPMGTNMRFPDAGTPGSTLDWEDADFTQKVAEAVIGGHELPDLDAYVRDRSYTPGAWGIKSPMLLPFLPDFVDALERAGRTPVLIVTYRPYGETLQSLNHQLRNYRNEFLEIVFNVQRALLEARQWAAERAALVIDVEHSRNEPAAVREALRVLIEKV
jgi:hypothetical protein